jgi:hypothetical protein
VPRGSEDPSSEALHLTTIIQTKNNTLKDIPLNAPTGAHLPQQGAAVLA